MARPTVLYQRNGVTVTTLAFQTTGQEYPVKELGYVERVVQGSLWQGRLYELWAWFRGQRTRLFRSLDAREFGQVCRALTRARERAGLT